MNNHVVKWNAPRVNADNSSVIDLGTLPTAFKDHEFFFQDKRLNKRATYFIKNPANTNETISVVLSEPVNDLYRAGKLTKLQLLSLPVFFCEKLKNKEGVTYDGYVLGKPGASWSNFSKVADKAQSVADVFTADDIMGY
jgi:hypothetical protein